MSPAYFLTGTDTEIGKTFITCALLHRARQAGLAAVGIKPVAAGMDDQGENDDVRAIRQANARELPGEWLNPYCFAPAIAPHIAAAEAGVAIDFGRIAAGIGAARGAADLVIVEGVGGFAVPLGPTQDSADLAVELALPVILVVGMRLGCISHALLTVEAIERRGLRLAGWVANRIDPAMGRFDENLAALQQRIAAPCLGIVPHAPVNGAAGAASYLSLPA